MAEICTGCGVEYAPKHKGQKYHAHQCFLETMNRDPERQSSKGKLGGTARGQQMKDSASGRGYVKLDGQHEHRSVAETVLGRALLPDEVVHHEDRNKGNNQPKNLIVFADQANHARHHKLNHLGRPCTCVGIRLGEVMPYATPLVSGGRA